jgi:ATP phosphoribosyltransferase regulatory subunit
MLPEGVEEILPAEANQLELLRRTVLDNLIERGFSLVMPPVMEFVDALLTGTGKQLDTQTYKFMDQHTQRMLGLRADITPQIARIDAHHLGDNAVNKLCYVGTVLRTRPDQMGGQRELMQLGAEIFGIADESADLEVLEAMLAILAISVSGPLTLSLSHAGIYTALIEAQNIKSSLEEQLFDVLARKSLPDLQEMSALIDITPFEVLLDLQGNANVLDRARTDLEPFFVDATLIDAAFDQLNTVVNSLVQTHPELDIHIDLADVSGYRYHTGLKFSAYVKNHGRAIAKGGRYDAVGEQFGRARPATGFSADLKSLFRN